MNRRDFCKVSAIAPVACVMGHQRPNWRLGVIRKIRILAVGGMSKVDFVETNRVIYDIRTEFHRKLFSSVLESIQTVNARKFIGRASGHIKMNTFSLENQKNGSILRAILSFEESSCGFDLHWINRDRNLTSHPVYLLSDFSKFFPWCDPNNIPWIGK